MTEILTARNPTAIGQRRSITRVLRLIAVGYVTLLVLVPVAVVLWRTFHPGLSSFVDSLTDPLTVHAFELSLTVALVAVLANTFFGIGVSILLARHRFPGRRLLSAFIDLPVAISPIVVGLALILVYGPSGWFGPVLTDAGFSVVGALPGMVLATIFVSLPLVVRAVVPVLVEAGSDQEQAARCLGAGALTTFRRITLPTIKWAVAYGVVLSLARCLGEYGAVLVVSGNVEGQTETATLRIDNLYSLDQQTDAAYAVTFVLIAISVLAIVVISLLTPKQES